MELLVLERGDAHVRAGYRCPCGCTPSVEFRRDGQVAEAGCCCGNRFALGPRAAMALSPGMGVRREVEAFDAPWGESLEAAWLIGPSVHGSGLGHGHADAAATGPALDPVCGMTVDRAAAKARGLHSIHEGVAYAFCGKGCKLEFDDDPERYFDPGYVPSM